MAKNNQRDPNLRAATVARVNQLVKSGLTKAGAFDRISADTGRAKDAVQMLYYRAIRASKAAKTSARPVVAPTPAAPKAAPKPAPKPAPMGTMTKPMVAKAGTPVPVAVAAPAPAAPKRSRRRRRRSAARPVAAAPRPQGVAQSGDFPALLSGIATAINALLKHVEKTVEENKTLKEQADRLKAITSLIRGR